ncbi:MAG: adenylosuccinate lyase, partial [Crenarchaeota archaeon]|nr:adenylosuccinate lyase [Thermoproteota archaeon]
MDYVCPLDWRYGSEEMRNIFRVENIVKKYIEVERALVCTLEELGIAERGCCEKITRAEVKPEEVYEMERKIGHDIAGLAFLLEEKSGCRFVHYGATSYDIVDTAWALLIREALKIIKRRLIELIEELINKAEKYADLIMIGRTHGQHALPITLGFKFANYVYELSRGLEALLKAEEMVVRGKMSGAVGTMAAWEGKGLEVERRTLQRLGLEPHAISTQVAPRDGFALLIATMAIVGSQLDRLALEIRELSRPEIGEMYEAFERVGSSAMPHKANPVTSEKVSGLAKMLRGLVIPALENIPLWHERDLTNSSCERILIPHAFLILDEMLISMLKVLKNLAVNEENIRKNLRLLRDFTLTEMVMNILIKRGVPRKRAHEILRRITRKYMEGKSLQEALLEDEEISKILTREDIERIRPENYLGNYRDLIQ